MTKIGDSTFEWLKFDEAGNLLEPGAPAAIVKDIGDAGATDLAIISHGWKTDEQEALALYEPLWMNVSASLKAAGKDPGKIVVAGVWWPSKQFETDFDQAASQVGTRPMGGQPLSIQPISGDGDLDPALLESVANEFATLVGGDEGQAVKLAALHTASELNPHNAKVLLQLATSAVIGDHTYDPELAALASGFDTEDPQGLLLGLFNPPALKVAPGSGGALSIGSVITNALMGPRAAVARLLNQLTYFEMKKRAGVVGQHLGSDVAPHLATPTPLRIHLIGHSFGGRLVTAAASVFNPAPNATLASLTLLQAAYSHNGLASRIPNGGGSGAFKAVIEQGKVKGPITITHTHNDSACTIAYALASRLSRDVSQALGDANDMFGAMGANGAQHLTTAAYGPDVTMVKAGASYDVKPGLVNDALGDACISEHMDVTNADVGALVASAIRAGAAVA